MVSDLWIIEIKDARVWKTTSWAYHTIKEAESRADEILKERLGREVRISRYVSFEKVTKPLRDNPFTDVDKRALQKYNQKNSKYGESWKIMHTIQLQGRLIQEMGELCASQDGEQLHQEALDVMNVARMIAERTKNVG